MENLNAVKVAKEKFPGLLMLVCSISIVLGIFAIGIYIEKQSTKDLPNTGAPRLCFLDHFFHVELDHKTIEREVYGKDSDHERECLDSYDRVNRNDNPTDRDYERAAEYINDHLS